MSAKNSTTKGEQDEKTSVADTDQYDDIDRLWYG
jgi:hypothetical protein